MYWVVFENKKIRFLKLMLGVAGVYCKKCVILRIPMQKLQNGTTLNGPNQNIRNLQLKVRPSNL